MGFELSIWYTCQYVLEHMQDYRKLQVWDLAHKFVIEIYKITKTFPKSEMFGLVSQLQRASVSIPTNIAEGSSKQSQADFARYLSIAIGSASEVDYLLFLCEGLKYMDEEQYMYLSTEIIKIRKMLISLHKKILS